jgi:WD40 repeat protein/class 3 adenylate cyclase/type II secretory pathway predicted ATPase ExeA
MLLSLQPHPGLPIVREDFFDGDRYCIVMDWVEGVSLSRVLADRGDPGLPPPEVAEYVSQTAAALDHLHGHQPPVVHQDVKPGNLILVPDGHVVLVDFGLSVPGGTDRPGRYGGTRGYAAPELAAGTATAAADVYGLAATAFALLTGGPPRGDLPTWEKIPRGTAGRIEPVIRQGLSIDPDRRHPSPGAFAAALADAVGAAPAARIAVETQIRTFLIADVRGYTSFTRDRGDEAAAQLAAAFAEVAREGVESRDGEVIELRGDEALAVFGSARQALRAAVELQVVFHDESSIDPSLPLAVGIGLDAGEAVPVEGGFRGAALNLAARLCASAGPGEVLVSQGLVHLASTVEGVRLEERVPLDFKGLDAPVLAWQATREDVSGPIGAPSEHRAAPTGKPQVLLDVPPELDPLTRLVGRDRDARWIRWAWRQARRGPGRIVVVTGSAGAGKTLLAAEAAQLAAREGGSVAYASSRRSPADVERAIAAAAGSSGPTLLVLDDLEAAGDAELAPIAELVDRLHERRLLVVGILRDGAASRTRTALERLAGGGEDRIRRLGPFDRDGVRAVAALYVEEPSSEVPVDTILQATGGAAPAVHRMAVRWAEGEAARRLGGAADQAARERMGLRTAEADVVSTVIDLQRVRERGELLTGPEERPVADEPPFKGLASFDVSDARYFFGRERLVAEMVARLAGSSFLAVVGPSGSGKSSAVRAGLLPTLAGGALPGSEDWIRVLLRPGEHPERELDRMVFAALPERLRSSLGSSQTSLEAARSLVHEERRHLLVVVDQAEELFTICHDDAERQRFLDSLTSTVRAPGVTVLLAIRADFYGRCSAHPALAELVADNHVLVGPMTEEEYRRAIELPARLAGLRIDRPLVDALVGEVVDEPGGLPLLSTALLELWQRRRGHAIRLESYSETGGVRGAVAGLAEQAYAELTVEQQAVAKGVLLRLSTGEGEVVTRRRVPILEFDPGTNPEVGAVLDTLIEARLLIADDGTVEVAHEALLREWPRLEAWLDEDRAGRRLREHLTDQAKEWERSGRESGDLYRGLRLSSALDWTADHAKELNDLEREFLSEGRAASERETERQRRTNRRLRGLLAGVAVFLVIALVAGGLALVQGGRAREEARRAEREARIATARELAAAALANLEVDPELSILLATEAVQTTRSFDGTVRREAEEALHRAIGSSRVELTVPGLGGWLAWSPEGVFVTEGPEDSGLIDIRDAETGRSVLSFHGHDEDVNQVAFSSDGSRLASTGDDGELKVWDPSSGRLLAGLSGSGSARGASFSADGSLVAAAWDGNERVRVLDLTTDREVSRTRVDGVIDTALSPDGRRIAVASDSGTAVFDVETGERVFRLGRGDSEDVSWSPDGRSVAVASDRDTRVWEAGTGRLQDTLLGHAGRVYSVAWSPDSSRLVTGGADGVAKVWEIGATGSRQLWSLSALGTRSGVQGLTFSPDGSRVMAGDLNVSTVTIWDLGSNGDAEWAHVPSRGEAPVPARFLPDGRQVAAISRSDGGKAVTIWDLSGREVETIAAATDDFPLSRLAVHPDGRSVAVGGWVESDGRRFGGEVVRVWDLATESELFRIRHRLDVNEVSYSPNGNYLATASWDGTAKIIDSSGRVIRVLPEGRDSNVSDVAFSPDGRLLATTVFTYKGSWEGRIRIWDWEREQPVRTFTSDVSVAGVPVSVEFDPTGSRIVAAGDNGRTVIWDVKSGSRVAVLAGQGGVGEAAFSPDGALVATARLDGTVRLFDADTGEEQLVLRGSGCEVWGVAFSPDGTKLASTSCDGVRIWALDIDDLLEIARREARRSLTDEECRQYLHVEECPALI